MFSINNSYNKKKKIKSQQKNIKFYIKCKMAYKQVKYSKILENTGKICYNIRSRYKKGGFIYGIK